MNISFPITFRPFSLLPHFLEREDGESKKAHWVGNKPPAQPEQERSQRGQPVPPGKLTEPRGYRDLASITLGEVQAAYDFFEKQLLPSPFPGWIGTNMFSVIGLKQTSESYRPPAIFGRVRTCHPSDGYLSNVQVMELLFPHKEAAPDLVLLYNEDIDPGQPVQSYGLRAMFLASPEELDEFKPSENLFLAQGLVPEFSASYIDLLHLREQDKESYPWFYVVGSRWFASIPESVKPEIREMLKNMVSWNKQLFNYHPRSLDPEIRTLNWVLELSYNFTEHFLTTPETPMDTVKILASSVGRMIGNR